MKTLKDWLLYLTNNEDKPVKEWRLDEVHFDIIFFVIIIGLLVLGLANVALYIITKNDMYLGIMFACEFAMCFIWIWDNLRHNRE